MNSVIIQRHLSGNKHVIFPRNAFLRLTVYTFCRSRFLALAQGEFCASISRLNLRVFAFNFSVKIKYLVVAVSLQCSCQLLYVHPCLSSHDACVRARVYVCAQMYALTCVCGCFTACEFGVRWLVPSRDGET